MYEYSSIWNDYRPRVQYNICNIWIVCRVSSGHKIRSVLFDRFIENIPPHDSWVEFYVIFFDKSIVSSADRGGTILGISMLCCGLITLLTAFAQGFYHVLVLRSLLGAVQVRL